MFYQANRSCSSGIVPYITQTGDTFYKISRYYNITLDDLLEANPDIDPDNFCVGEAINIPLALQRINCHTGTEMYTIKHGDTIYNLAKKLNIKISTLIKANKHINPDALLPGQIIYTPKPWNKYINKSYNITFLYPTRWAKVNALCYEGVDGFFRISVIKSDKALEDICRAEAYHKLKPYGSNPTIVNTNAANCDACLVIPSQDQPMEMKKQAALVIKYPQDMEIDNKMYSHIIIWANLEQIYDIKNNIALA